MQKNKKETAPAGTGAEKAIKTNPKTKSGEKITPLKLQNNFRLTYPSVYKPLS